MDGLTNAQRKTYASLATVKGRRQHAMFMAQGTKCVADTIGHFQLVQLLATPEWIDSHPEMATLHHPLAVKPSDLKAISTLTTPQGVIAIYSIPPASDPDISGQLVVALDGVQDPGNLGTIMRVADWMGVRTIIASVDTVDVWSPKVIQATMGAVSRVKVHYTDLPEFLGRHTGVPVYGTFLDGDDIYSAPLEPHGIVLMGNEGSGVRDLTASHVSHRLYIPPYPPDALTSESLNVAVATAITLAEFRRRARQ